jgi:hypothetical protein
VKAVLYLLVAADPGSQGGRAGVAVAGDEVDDLDGLLALLRDRAAQLRDLAFLAPEVVLLIKARPGLDKPGANNTCRPAMTSRRRRTGWVPHSTASVRLAL